MVIKQDEGGFCRRSKDHGMSRLPMLKAREVVPVLEKLGYQKARQAGSHAQYVRPGKKSIPVRVHVSQDICRGLLMLNVVDIVVAGWLTDRT